MPNIAQFQNIGKGTDMPIAIVLGLEVTGLGTVRGLAEGGVEVHGVALSPKNNPGRYSRLCRVINLYDLEGKPDLLSEWLYVHAKRVGGRPVVFPTSDVLALMLAKHGQKLEEVCRIWGNDFSGLETIVSKQRLYQACLDAGVSVPPFLLSPSLDSVKEWSEENPPPYLLKPCYNGSSENTIGKKNYHISSKEELLDIVKGIDTSGLILMRILRGGDGNIFDCYGLCSLDGKVKTMASHRRIRQHLMDFGSTCYGEIPGNPEAEGEEGLFKRTETLLSNLHYHGIFGIEWLQENNTNKLYMIDFNARPFSSIGHLMDSGLNLPLLAYCELCGIDLSGVPYTPELKHLFWLDFMRDALTFMECRRRGALRWDEWFNSLIKSRSFACWNVKDPGPGIYRSIQLLSILTSRVPQKIKKKMISNTMTQTQ